MKSFEWLDRIVDALERLNEISMENVNLISPRNVKEVHLAPAEFDRLAHTIGAVIIYNPNWAEHIPEAGEEYFMYRGCKIFSLWDKKGATK